MISRWPTKHPILVLNPPVAEAKLALAAQAAGAVGLVDPATTDAKGVGAALLRAGVRVPFDAKIVVLADADDALAARLAAEGRIVLAVASARDAVPAAHAVVARGDTPRATVEAVKALAGARPVFAWGPLDRPALAQARAAGAAGWIVEAAFWNLPESPAPAPEPAAKLAAFVARRSRTLARAIEDLVADAAAEPPVTLPPRPQPSPSPSPSALSPQPSPSALSPEPPRALSPEPSALSPQPSETQPVADSIAIVGMGCVFPGAPDLAAYWDLLVSGRSAIREVDPKRWDPAYFYDADPKAPDKTYSKIGGFVDDVAFNAAEFRIPPAVAKQLDGVQKMALVAARQALEDAGLAAIPGGKGREFDRARTAVILGNSLGGEGMHSSDRRVYFSEIRAQLVGKLPADELDRIETEYKARFHPITEDTMPGELGNVAAGRIANVFNLAGKNHTTDAACASSIAALDAAIATLASGEFDLVLCGGADRSMDAASYVKFSKIGALSATGSKPFDADADGFVQGEGAGVLVLKRLADAVREGDRIYGIVRSVGSSSDGRGKGITAPNPEGQKHAVRRALASGRLAGKHVQYVECHGTGTPVGDPVELESLSAVFGAGLPPATVPVGSVKSQIGHLKSAAGAASLIKVALALHHGTIPPTINVRRPNPAVPWASIPFYPNTQPSPWPTPAPGEPLRAAISAFGFGGTNFNAVVEQYVPAYHARALAAAPAAAEAAPAPVAAPAVPPSGVVVIGAVAPDGLLAGARAAKARLAAEPRATAAARGRAAALAQPIRATLAGDAEALDLLKPGADPKTLALKGLFVGHGKPGKVAFLFPGQGSQYAGMLKDLAATYPIVKATFDEADRVLAPLIGAPLTSFLDDEAALTRTEITQPAVLTADVAILRLFEQWGLRADVVAGHSLGEYAALVAAGVLRFEDALVAVSARGAAMANVKVPDLGKMAAVQADAASVEAVLREVDGYVVPANKNSPEQVVIAGATKAVEDAVAKLNAKGLPCAMLNVSAAFHSSIVAPASGPLRTVLEKLEIGTPRVPVIANVNAEPYPMGREAILDMLSKQVASPVEWQATIERLHADGVTVFVEIGPKRVLAGLADRILVGKNVVVANTNHPKTGGLKSLDLAVARLAAAGVPMRLPDLPVGSEAPASPAPSALVSAAAVGRGAGSETRTGAAVVVSGASVGLPGRAHRVFDDANVQRLLRGDSGIDRLTPDEEQALLDRRVVRLVKDGGEPRMEKVTDRKDVLHLAGKRGVFDLAVEYGLDPKTVETWDTTTRLAVAAAMDALRDAGIPLVREQRVVSNGKTLPGGWVLPESLRDETGIIFASAFPGYDNLVAALEADRRGEPFDRKFLFKVLSFGHAELAELIRARGPCTQINAACASTTQALAIAQDWITAGRCRRVLVVGADDVTSDRLMPWIGAGFLASGAATTAEAIEDGALPFDRRRNGMIIGMGAVGLVLEREDACAERGVVPSARLLATRIANSAHHGSRLDVDHIAGEVEKLVAEAARVAKTTPREMAKLAMFVSHETYTPARGGSAAAEVAAIRRTFGDATKDVLVVNVKGYTGHPMGAGLEDALAVKALEHDLAPPVPNLVEPDEGFGDLNFAKGGPHGRRFALRLAAGFGSQLALAAFEGVGRAGLRIDAVRHAAWVARVSGNPAARLELVKRTLRVAEDGAVRAPVPAPQPIVRLAPQPTPQPVRPVTVAAPPVAAAASAVVDVRARVVALVAAKTGYTEEQLDLDLDMEADLGIDTVKQAELMGALREAYALPREDGLRIKDYPTLRHVIRYVEARAGVAPMAAMTPKAPDVPDAPAAEVPVVREVPAVAAAPVARDAPAAPLVRAPAARSYETVLSLLTAVTAEKSGYPVEALDPTLDLEADLGIDTVKQAEIFGIVRERLALPRPDGLRLKDYPTLAAVARFLTDLPGGVAEAAPEAVPAAAPALPSGARHLVPSLVESPLAPAAPQPVVVFDARAAPAQELFLRAKRDPASLGPHLVVVAPRAGDPRALGALGLGRALARELNLAVTTVELEDTPLEVALPIEAAHPPPPAEPREVAWLAGRRFAVTHEARPGVPSPVPFSAGDLIVASGGAQGIAAECLKSLAPARPRLLLLGRTELPAAVAALAAVGDAQIDAKRREAAEALKSAGKKATPVAVEKAVAPWTKGRAIARTIRELEALGATVRYVSCDVADADAVRRVLADARDAVGLLHAAGVEESKLLADKDEGAWDRTWQPKVEGAFALVEALPALRWATFFGSVAGRFGNVGQADYSAANAALAGLARALSARGVRATCIDWTAWGETGMATRGSTLKVLGEAGVEALATAEGVAAFRALVGSPEPEVVVARSLPWARDARVAPSLLTRIVERTPDRVVAEMDLAADAPWMRDHAIDGTPVLAGVLALESFAQAAAYLLPAGRVEVAEASFRYAVKLLRNQPVAVRIEAVREGDAVRCRSLTTPPAPAGVAPEPRVHAEAVVRRATGALPAASRVTGAPWGVGAETIYRAFFHGPEFRVLGHLTTLAPDGAIAEMAASDLPARLTPAAASEAAFQALGAWALAGPGSMALPSEVGRIAWDGPVTAPLRIVVAGARVADGRVVGDVVGLDETGRVRLSMTDVRLVIVGPAVVRLPGAVALPVRAVRVGDREANAVRIADVSGALDACLAALPAPERERALAFPVEKRRVEYVAGALALAAAGGRRSAAPRDVPPVGASLSHAGEWAIAVPFDAARESVGIDVERVEPRAAAWREEAFGASERASLADDRDATRAWCVKEAVLKALGTGLKVDLHALSVALSPLSVDLSGSAKEAFAAAGGATLELAEADLDGHAVALAVLRR